MNVQTSATLASARGRSTPRQPAPRPLDEPVSRSGGLLKDAAHIGCGAVLGGLAGLVTRNDPTSIIVGGLIGGGAGLASSRNPQFLGNVAMGGTRLLLGAVAGATFFGIGAAWAAGIGSATGLLGPDGATLTFIAGVGAGALYGACNSGDLMSEWGPSRGGFDAY